MTRGRSYSAVRFDPNLFAPGQYTVGLWATGPTTRDHIRVAGQFSVSLVDSAGDSLPRQLRRHHPLSPVRGPWTGSVRIRRLVSRMRRLLRAGTDHGRRR